MSRIGSVLIALFCVAVFCGPAGAGSTIEPKAVELYPTWSAVGVEVSYDGDDDRTGTAQFVWRKSGETEWRNGVDMTYDRARRLIWASIWPLEQGDAVEVKVSFADAYVQEPIPSLEGGAVVKTMLLEPQGGDTFYVSPKGGDTADGTKDKPFKTIAQAAAAAGPGDAVYVMSGVYHEGDLAAGLVGTPEKPILFAAAPGEKPVLDGSVTIDKGAAWEKVQDGVYSIAVPAGQEVGYVAQDGKRMYLFRSLDDLKAGRQETDWGSKFEVHRAWHIDKESGRLFVRTGDEMTPGQHTYNLAVLDHAFLLAGSKHVVVRGFEMRYYSDVCVLFTEGADGCVAIDNAVHNSQSGMSIRKAETVNCAIWRNDVREDGLLDFTWDAIKGSGYSRQGISGFGGRGHSVCYNTVYGWFDGVCPVTWQRPDAIELNRDFDIMHNDIYNIGDDAIEIDGGGVNMRIHANRMRNVFAAMSLAPVERGPLYVTHNDASYYLLMFKLNVGSCTSNGWTYAYHNSGYCLTGGDNYGGTAISFANGESIQTYNKVFKNNAFVCDGLGIRFGHEGNWLDYNCYWNVPGQESVSFAWEEQDQPSGRWGKAVVFDSLEEFRAASGRERHGMEADPRFVSAPRAGEVSRVDFGNHGFTDYPQAPDTSEGDMRLQPSSPCIDAGVVIRGVNETFAGKAPDIGAHEHSPAQ